MVSDRLDRLMMGVQLTGNLAADVVGFLHHFQRPDLAKHVARVAANAGGIAAGLGEEIELAAAVGWLHDISQVLSPAEMLGAAEELGFTILAEERRVPFLLHGRVSAVMAQRYFGMDDVTALEAMRYHSTLRAGATRFDKLLFAADKLAWDVEHAPYVENMRVAMEISLDEGVRTFLRWAWAERAKKPVVHPWLVEAYHDLCS